MKTITTLLLEIVRSNYNYLSVLFFCVCFPVILSAHNSLDNITQTNIVEAPTIVLNTNENTVVANIMLTEGQNTIISMTFSVIFDNEVLKPTSLTTPGGAFNFINGNELIIGIFSVEPQIASISFDFIGGPGTQSPLIVNVENIFDISGNEVSSSTQSINGNISKLCAANPIFGCTNDNYAEYDPSANCDNGTCTTLNCAYDLHVSGSGGMPIDPGVYQAENDITTDGIINANEVTYSAGNSVELQYGFEVMLGAVSNIIMEGCN